MSKINRNELNTAALVDVEERRKADKKRQADKRLADKKLAADKRAASVAKVVRQQSDVLDQVAKEMPTKMHTASLAEIKASIKASLPAAAPVQMSDEIKELENKPELVALANAFAKRELAEKIEANRKDIDETTSKMLSRKADLAETYEERLENYKRDWIGTDAWRSKIFDPATKEPILVGYRNMFIEMFRKQLRTCDEVGREYLDLREKLADLNVKMADLKKQADEMFLESRNILKEGGLNDELIWPHAAKA